MQLRFLLNSVANKSTNKIRKLQAFCLGDKRSEEDADASNEDEEKQRMSPEHKLMSSTRRTAVDKEEEHDSGHGSVSCRTTGDVSVEIQVHAHTVSTR